MNIIKKQTLTGELKYKNTVVLTYKIEYAEITDSNYTFGKNIFNQFNKYKAMELQKRINNQLFKDASELYDYNKEHGYPIMVYDIVLSCNITYNQDNLVSLYYDQYEFTGGAHGNTIRTSQTWDLSVGRMLNLVYFFRFNPNYFVLDNIKNINNQIAEQLKSNPGQYFDNYCELVIDNFKQENYYLTNNGIVIYYQQYDIAPYSSGIPEFLIPIN